MDHRPSGSALCDLHQHSSYRTRADMGHIVPIHRAENPYQDDIIYVCNGLILSFTLLLCRFQVVLTTIVNIGPSIATYGCVIFVR